MLEIDDEGVTGELRSAKEIEIETGSDFFPDLIGYLQNETELTRGTILEILLQSGKLSDALVNPQEEFFR